jgi:hypothetical protein
MDNMNRNEHESGIFTMEIDATAQATFLEMARWTKFLALVGFIFMGLIVLACVGAGIFLSNSAIPQLNGLPMGFLSILYLVLALIYVYPIYALYKYSVIIKKAIKTADRLLFNMAIGYMKSMFKYIGVLFIIIISIYGFILIVTLGALAFRHAG